jgi:hypothetical protein
MSTLLIIGSITGSVVGAFHAWGVYTHRIREAGTRGSGPSPAVRLGAAYSAIWTFVLWAVFGTYVLVLWLVSIPIWVGHRVSTSRSTSAAGA